MIELQFEIQKFSRWIYKQIEHDEEKYVSWKISQRKLYRKQSREMKQWAQRS